MDRKKQKEQKIIPAINEVVAAIVAERSLNDKTFAQEMRNDAKGALEKVSGMQFEPSIKVHVVKNTENNVHIPIPEYAVLNKEEYRRVLSDAEMSAISGGEIFVSVAIGVGLGAAATAISTVFGVGLVGGVVVGTAVGVGVGAAGITAVGLGVGLGVEGKSGNSAPSTGSINTGVSV